MKNIYEDNQHDDEIKRPSFDFNAPIEGFGSKQKQDPKPAEESEQNVQPTVQLTAEQLSSIISLLYSKTEESKSDESKAEESSVKEEKSPLSAADPGKKILFQSDDFDSQPTGERKLPPIKGGITVTQESLEEDRLQGAYKAKPVLHRSTEQDKPKAAPQMPKRRSAVKTTNFGEDFNISEIEIGDGEFQNQAAVRKPQIVKSGAQQKNIEPSFGAGVEQPTRTSVRSIPNVDVEEVDIDVSPLEKQKTKKKKRSKGEIIRLVVLIVSLAAILISGAYLIREYILHKENQNLEKDLSNLIIEDETTDQEETTKKGESEKTTQKKEEKTTLSTEQKWEQVKAQYPNIIFPPNMQIKYAKLYATNTDFVGYLDIPGVNLSLPVVQTSDNETYLGKNFYGASTKYGCPFVAYENNITQFDTNTVIYGHHMNDGTIFGALDKYKSIDGFKAAPVIEFNTLYGNYKWKVIAAFITNAEQEDDSGYVFNYFFTNLSTKEHFASYLNELSQRSLYDTGVDVTVDDKLLTLSTCSHEFDNARFVVVARLVRTGESAKVDTSLAAENGNPRYPQAYYTKKRLTNPYAYANRWYPN